MKKCIIKIFIFISILFAYGTVNAAYLNVSANRQTIYVGESVIVTVSASDLMGVYSISSSNNGVLKGGDTQSIDSGDQYSRQFEFTSSAVGTANIVVSPVTLSIYSSEQVYNNSSSVTINVVNRPSQQQTTPIPINRTYSANNYLSGIAITGYQLTPAFDKETLEYNLEVDYTVEKINIETAVEDEKATVNGAGEHEVSEGNNSFDVVVTAENGNERTYKVNIIVKEIDPIEVIIDKEKYTVVKKDTLLKKLDNYEKITTKIKDKEVPALKGKITEYTLVGLKDSKGKINLYIYDDKNNSYTKYNEFKFDGLNIYPMEKDKDGYTKTVIKINGNDVTSYKKKGFNYYLIYGMNLATGETNWYTYDSEEKTLQRYIESNNTSNEKSDNYLFLIYILSSVIGLLIVFIMILFIKYKKVK